MPESNLESTPSLLYRYRRTGASLAYTFREIEGELWCACAHNLNDPFDGCTHAPITQDFLRAHYEDGPTGTTQLIPVKTHWGVACFTATWENPAMWAHYAEGYTGVCIGYDFPKLKEWVDSVENTALIADEFTKNNHDWCHTPKRGTCLRSVQYHRDFPAQFESELEAIYSKTKQWYYEAEWRLARQGLYGEGGEETEGTTFRFDPKTILREVIIGHRASKATIRATLSLIEARQLPITCSIAKPIIGLNAFTREILVDGSKATRSAAGSSTASA